MSHVLSLRLAAMARIARGEEEDVDPELVNVTGWADALERASAELRRREQAPVEESEIVKAYYRVVRAPLEGTGGAAIETHAQACGLVAYVFGVHPDAVAREVKDAERYRR